MRAVVVLLVLCFAACNSAGLPTTPSDTVFPTTPSSNNSPVIVIPPAPGTVLSIAMPIDGADIVSNAFGLLPFGYHGADHAGGGHSGWDIEYRIGAQVRAAAWATRERSSWPITIDGSLPSMRAATRSARLQYGPADSSGRATYLPAEQGP